MATESTEFGTGKTIIVLTIVIGCFAVLWPKIFYPAIQSTTTPAAKTENVRKPVCIPCVLKFEEERKIQFHYELCSLILKDDRESFQKPRPASLMFRLCREAVLQACHMDMDDKQVQNLFKSMQGSDSPSIGTPTWNLTMCLETEFSIDSHIIAQAMQKRNVSTTKHIHQERPPHLRPDMMHPALREKGQNIPPRMRTIEKDARPGPMPGMRPTIGGPGHVVQSSKQTSTMSIVMPIYTLAIVIFFIYTITKVLFKKQQDTAPKVMDFHMDPEHRKFVLSDEYSESDPYSMKAYLRKQERDQRKLEAEKENSKIVIDAIEGIVKEIDEYKAQRAEEEKKDTASSLDHAEAELADDNLPEEEPLTLTRDQTQQVDPSTHIDEPEGQTEDVVTPPKEHETEEECPTTKTEEEGGQEMVQIQETEAVEVAAVGEEPMVDTPIEEPLVDIPVAEPSSSQVETLEAEAACTEEPAIIQRETLEAESTQQDMVEDLAIAEAEKAPKESHMAESAEMDTESSTVKDLKTPETESETARDQAEALSRQTSEAEKSDDSSALVTADLEPEQVEIKEIGEQPVEEVVEHDISSEPCLPKEVVEIVEAPGAATESPQEPKADEVKICEDTKEEKVSLPSEIEESKDIQQEVETLDKDEKSLVTETAVARVVTEEVAGAVTGEVAGVVTGEVAGAVTEEVAGAVTEEAHIPEQEERLDETTPTPDVQQLEAGEEDLKEIEVTFSGTKSPEIREIIVGDEEKIDDRSILSYILDGSVASDMQLLVSEAQCEALSLEECHLNDTSEYADISDPVVISGKMTISFIEGTSLSSLSEVPDISMDVSQSKGLPPLPLDEEISTYAELPLDEPSKDSYTPEEDVLADIERQIVELENAMKEVQEAAGILKEQDEGELSESEAKVTEAEDEEVSEYKSVRVEEVDPVSTADDYKTAAHQASHLTADQDQQEQSTPPSHSCEQPPQHGEQDIISMEPEPQQKEDLLKEERTMEGITEDEEDGTGTLEVCGTSQDFVRDYDQVSETDSENPVLYVHFVDEALPQEIDQVEAFEQQRYILSEKPSETTDSQVTAQQHLQEDKTTEIGIEHVVKSVEAEEHEEVPEEDRLSETDSENPVLSIQYVDKEVVDVDKLSEPDLLHPAYSEQQGESVQEIDKLSETDSEHPVLSVQDVDQQLLEVAPEEDKLSETDSEHPVLSVQYVDQQLLEVAPEEDKLSETDSEHPVLSVQYVDQQLLEVAPEEDKLSETDSEHPVLSVQYVDQQLEVAQEEDKLSETDSEHPVLSVQYVDQQLLEVAPEEDKLSETDSEHPVLSVQYVDQQLLEVAPEEDKLSETDSEHPVLSVQYVDQELLDNIPEVDKLSETDSEHPVLSVQYVDRDITQEASGAEADNLSETDSDLPVLSVQYVDGMKHESGLERSVIQHAEAIKSEESQIPEQEVQPQEEEEELEFTFYPDTLTDEAREYVEKLAAVTVQAAIAEAQRRVASYMADDEHLASGRPPMVEPSGHSVQEALAEAMREERSPSPTDMVHYMTEDYSREGTPCSREGTPEGSQKLVEHTALVHDVTGSTAEVRSPTEHIEHAAVVHDAGRQTAVIDTPQVTDVKHQSFPSLPDETSVNVTPDETSAKVTPNGSSSHSSFEMVGSPNGESTSSFEHLSRNGSPLVEEEEEEEEEKTEPQQES